MSSRNTSNLWNLYLESQISSTDDALLATAIGIDEELLERVLTDAEVDSMLRSVAGTSENEEERFINAVLQQLDSSEPSTAQSQPALATPPPIESPNTSQQITTASSASSLWRTTAALSAVAVCMLVAFVISQTETDQQDYVSPSSRSAELAIAPKSVSPEQHVTHESQPSADIASPNSLPSTETIVTDAKRIEKPSVAESPDELISENPERMDRAYLVSASNDVQWYATPQKFEGQSLELQSGSIELKMASGVSLHVHAPTHFQVDSTNSVILGSGSLSAKVPESAIGFAVETPTARVVDLGTRFDVQVAERGETSVAVTQGEVAIEGLGSELQQLVAGQHGFVDAKGTLWDWKLIIEADIFGSVTGSINGQTFSSSTPENFQSVQDLVLKHPAMQQANTRGTVCYEVNGVQHLSDPDTTPADIAARVSNDMSVLEEITRKAADDSGAYSVKNRLYVYGNLKEKLISRRTVARTFGSRALSPAFSQHEKFETTGPIDTLLALQAELNKRIDVKNLSGLGFGQPRRGRVTEPVVVKPVDSDPVIRAVPTHEASTRESLFRLIENIKSRKSAAPDKVPARNVEIAKANQKRSRVNRKEQTSKLTKIVNEALKSELAGDQAQRSKLLHEALAKDSDFASANWQLGNVKVAGEWISVNEAQTKNRESAVWGAFNRLRQECAGKPSGDLQLARWCKTRRPDVAKVYYQRLLDNPSVTNSSVRSEAAQNLGLALFNGRYVKASELEQLKRKRRDRLEALGRWSKPLAKWEKWLRPTASKTRQTEAKRELSEVDDSSLVLATNSYAFNNNEMFGLHLLEELDQYDRPEVAIVLSNYALNNPSEVLRRTAIRKLKLRKLHDYVPDLLGELIGGVHSNWRITSLADGTLRYEHVIRREGAMQDQELRVVREAEPISIRVESPPSERPPNAPRGIFREVRVRNTIDLDAQELIKENLEDSAEEREQAIRLANERAAAYNKNLFELLTTVTEQELQPIPSVWWDWWTGYNEISIEKPTQYGYDYDNIQFANQLYQDTTGYVRHACFAAGTIVATETGMRPINELAPGDRVYAKDIHTGELALKAVAVRTVRNAKTIVELKIGDEIIRTTQGHPFWVAGKGWTMAKLLQTGDQLHGLGGALVLDEIQMKPGEPVYNLILSDFHNYFVGSIALLAHDHTFRNPTGHRLPGLE